MFAWLDSMYILAKVKTQAFVEDFKNDESGVSNFVATVLLILMVVLIAGAVWGFLSGFFSDLFGQIGQKSTEMNGSDITY